MPNLDYQEFTRRRRPHLNPPDGTYFLTFRLADSIPRSEVRFHKGKNGLVAGSTEKGRTPGTAATS